MIDVGHSIALIAVMTGVILLTRFLPFLIFSKGAPEPIVYLGKVLPSAIMGMLVVYCLKDMTFLEAPYGAAEILGVLIVIAVHKWRHNTMLSLLVGAVAYMFLVQAVF
jgi:branched-subunit amino acid transport protein AzlD